MVANYMEVTLNIRALTPLEKLDTVLNSTHHQRTYYDLIVELGKDPKLNTDEHTLRLILNKLLDDGYIDFINGNNLIKGVQASEGVSIRRNFNGDLFLLQGGYVEEARTKKQKEDMNDASLRRAERNELLIIKWNAVVGFGAIGIILWEMFKYFVGRDC